MKMMKNKTKYKLGKYWGDGDIIKETTESIAPYQLKHSDIGYWIDGACGWQVVGYFDSLTECLNEFKKEVKKEKRYPIWRYE